jgi:hypothetical protein
MRRPLQRRCLSAKCSSRIEREFFQKFGGSVDLFGMLVAVLLQRPYKRFTMKATVASHSPVPDGESEQIYRFGFVLEAENGAPPYAETISLRTARVLVAHLEDGNAFVEMLRAIVAIDVADYDSLIGRRFDDHLQPSRVAPLVQQA